MAKANELETLSLPQACRELGWSYQTGWNRCLAGILDGQQTGQGKWIVTRTSVEAAKRDRQQLSTATSPKSAA